MVSKKVIFVLGIYVTLAVIASIVHIFNIFTITEVLATVQTETATPTEPPVATEPEEIISTSEIAREEDIDTTPSEENVGKISVLEEVNTVFTVPFYSQFNDITPQHWKGIGCGIASLAMLIEFYTPGSVSVDRLLEEGIRADAYLTNVGWTYAGLIGISKKYGLGGRSYDYGTSGMDTAFSKLEDALLDGPVMVSVHYTFDPKNPIPHLVIANGVDGDTFYYNDPAEPSGGGSIPVSQFKSSWKKRYIEIRPTS